MKKNPVTAKFTKFTSLALCLFLLLSMVVFTPSVADAAKGIDNRERVIVSMGDSFSAGEGIFYLDEGSDYFYDQNKTAEEKYNSQEWRAHRSKYSWPGRLTLDGVAMERNKNWYFVASSGAVTGDITGEQSIEYKRDGYDTYLSLPPQIDVFNDEGLKNKKIEYITITIGGNDMGFSTVIREASLGGYLMLGNLPDLIESKWTEFYEGGIRESIRQTYCEIYKKACENNPDVKIIVAGYPKLLEKDGKGAQFTKEDAILINKAVEQFNNELEAIVNSCKADGMRICFVPVDVEGGFRGHEVYTDEPYINSVKLLKVKDYDLVTSGFGSSGSMHPNGAGAQIYKNLVQAKIDSIEADGGKSEWPDMGSSEERDVVLVLDASGSMDGIPMEETKEASIKFVNTVLKEEASIGIVSYDESAMRIANFSKNANYLIDTTENLNAGGGTNMEAGLKKAHEMLSAGNAKKKIIVLMSDGEPNRDKVGEELIAYADELKKEGIYIYTLGFFSDSSSYSEAQRLMERIASPGCHHEVDDAANLVFFFNDIADQIRGEKYIYVRIACPVDVTVKYNGEVLSSKDAQKGQRTSFGTLTFEENLERNENSTDNRIKTLRLKDGYKYDIKISGNGRGTMDYTIGFMDDDGNYSDLREFSDIKITPRTKINTVAVNADTTTLRVDEDGDGDNDYIYRARKNSKGEVLDCKVLMFFLFAPMIVLLIIVVVIIRKKRKTKVGVAVGPGPADKEI